MTKIALDSASLLIVGATIIDAVADRVLEDQSIWIEGGRIRAIDRRDGLGVPRGSSAIDAHGKYVIPGLMNANVHLLGDIRVENLTRYMDHYEDLIVEAAQVALKGGLTTVFDTWGPRRFLMAARCHIDSGETPGSRIFCAGNIIGFDGPFSEDFIPRASEIVSASVVKRINAIWVENTGRHLMWLPPSQVASEIRTYIDKGIDFVKYGSNEHFRASAGAFLAFSPQVQTVIVDAAHGAGLTAQAHATSVEGLRLAVEAGCDLIQHANVTGPVPIPEATLEQMARRKTAAAIFPWTKRGLAWVMENASEMGRTMWKASDLNADRLVRSGVPLLLANDGTVYASGLDADPLFRKSWIAAPEEDGLGRLGTGHFVWFKAMEEKGCPPMEMLRAATRNIAVAYGKDRDLGTVEAGKIADLLILDKNPLESAENYRSIHLIIKDGQIVDRDSLPTHPILTRPLDPLAEEEASYIPFLTSGDSLPMCPMCIGH